MLPPPPRVPNHSDLARVTEVFGFNSGILEYKIRFCLIFIKVGELLSVWPSCMIIKKQFYVVIYDIHYPG